jgi:hypothetical protein
MKGTIILPFSLLLATGCTRLAMHRQRVQCTRQFLYTEYSTGRGGTLDPHPVYGCADRTQPATPRGPVGS